MPHELYSATLNRRTLVSSKIRRIFDFAYSGNDSVDQASAWYEYRWYGFSQSCPFTGFSGQLMPLGQAVPN